MLKETVNTDVIVCLDKQSECVQKQKEIPAKPDIPPWCKYTMGIEEAARYYGIGIKKLRQIVSENPEGDFYLEIGRHVLLKRRQFEVYLDGATSL